MESHKNELKQLIINVIRKLGKATYEELLKELINKGVDIDDIELRKVIASLVREGVIVKLPNPKKMKFEYSLSSRSNPEY
ncbi:MAG: hypothetical protein B6U85_02490 [Desulfurococcales archaeon ex4484_42]|nr:MAG: hypothetical protein B6U85_02490 [Desulfurococcales archaeon ex4484_42]